MIIILGVSVPYIEEKIYIYFGGDKRSLGVTEGPTQNFVNMMRKQMTMDVNVILITWVTHVE